MRRASLLDMQGGSSVTDAVANLKSQMTDAEAEEFEDLFDLVEGD
jgi:hypothetical protein